MQTLSSIVLALLSLVFSVAAFAETGNVAASFKERAAGKQKYYQMRLVNNAEKSTRVQASYCNAPYIGDIQRSGETLAVFVTVQGCSSMSTRGPAWEFRDKRIQNGLAYYLMTKNPERVAEVAPPIGWAQPGDEVQVIFDRMAEFSIGTTSFSVSPLAFDGSENPFALLSANVGGMGAASVSEKQCSASGCVATSSSEMYNLMLLDRVIPVFPGTAVIGLDGKLVGLVLGYDNGITVVMSASQAANALCEMSDVPQNCKG